MTVLTAHYDGKVLVPEQPVDLPTGVPLRVTVELAGPSPTEKEKPIWQIAEEIGRSVPHEVWATLPRDGARNLDHYLYGSPKDDE